MDRNTDIKGFCPMKNEVNWFMAERYIQCLKMTGYSDWKYIEMPLFDRKSNKDLYMRDAQSH